MRGAAGRWADLPGARERVINAAWSERRDHEAAVGD
jgi:hypothetical protein